MNSAMKVPQVRLDRVTSSYGRVVLDNPPLNLMGPEFVSQMREIVTELAERKAYTSALVRVRTADLVPLVQPGAELYPLLAVSGGRYSAMGGGVPITSDGQVIAGVGVSGGTTQQDIAIVEAATN